MTQIGGASRQRRSSWGQRERLPSGRWRARYQGPDGQEYSAAVTFDNKSQADAWLAQRHSEVVRDVWKPPRATGARVTLERYAQTWLAERTVRGRPLQPRTLALYRDQLDRLILPTFGNSHVEALTAPLVRSWYTHLGDAGPRQRDQAYGLLRAILNTAVIDDLLEANPCRIKGAGASRRAGSTKPATPAEISALIDAMPVRYKAMIALAAWCGLRHGELAGLYRRDIDVTAWTVTVERAVVKVRNPKSERQGDGAATSIKLIGRPKTEGSARVVPIPANIRSIVQGHLTHLGSRDADSLLFPSANDPTIPMDESVLRGVFKTAKDAIGRSDLRIHDLRHTYGSNATSVGAALPEVMRLMGHTTVAAAMRYQHEVQGRHAEIAAKLSQLAGGEQ